MHIQRLKDMSNFKIMVFNYPNRIPEVKFNDIQLHGPQMIDKFGQWNSERELIEILNNYKVFPDKNNLHLLLANEDVAKVVTEQRKKQAKIAMSRVQDPINLNPNLNPNIILK